MRFSSFCQRIGGDGSQAWDIHMRALLERSQGKDVIIMSVGDPDMDTPREVVKATVVPQMPYIPACRNLTR